LTFLSLLRLKLRIGLAYSEFEMSAKEKETRLQADAITQIANVSTLLRRAIAAAIPGEKSPCS
jgi:hypothetical protein